MERFFAGPDKSNKPEEEEDVIDAGKRRLIFGGAAIAGSTLLGGVASLARNHETPTGTTLDLEGSAPVHEHSKERVHHVEKQYDHVEAPKDGLYDTGELAGRKVSDLFAFYLGLPEHSEIPEKLKADFAVVLQSLWDKKIDFVQRKKPEWIGNTNYAMETFTKSYNKAQSEGTLEKMSLSDMLTQANEIIAETNAALDWDKLNTVYEFHTLSDDEIEVVKQLAQQITGEMLIAYSITELMPSLKDSKLNVDIYEFLAKNAGPDFLQRVPAVHDPYLSAGMYQFTSFAVFDDGAKPRGASLISKLLTVPEIQLPGSVIMLESFDQQTRAAFLFAVSNLAELVKHIGAGGDEDVKKLRLQRLGEQGEKQQIGLLQYIASAHHNPAGARAGYEAWIDQDFQGSHADCCKPDLGDYIRKSNGNYLELRKRIELADKQVLA